MARDWREHELRLQAAGAAGLYQDLLDLIDESDDDFGLVVNDAIEGETDFLEILDRVSEAISEAESLAIAIGARIDKLRQRQTRMKEKALTLRDAITRAMLVAGNGKLPFSLVTPGATISVKTKRPKVIIENEADIPAKYWKQPDPVLDRAAINDAAKEGGDLPAGVGLTAPGYALAIRRA